MAFDSRDERSPSPTQLLSTALHYEIAFEHVDGVRVFVGCGALSEAMKTARRAGLHGRRTSTHYAIKLYAPLAGNLYKYSPT